MALFDQMSPLKTYQDKLYDLDFFDFKPDSDSLYDFKQP